MKDYANIISKVTSTPWMMAPASLRMMLEILDAHLNNQMSEEEIRSRVQAARHASDKLRQEVGNIPRTVGVLPLHGPIFPKANMMTELSGATSLEEWRGSFRQLVADESVSSIILDIDSPGGSSDMIPEMMAEIRAARDVKPIYAVANTMAASAAYGLASQATKMFASPSALTGSIGTYMVHTDESPFLEKMGIKETVIKAGRFKAAEIESLTPESRAYLEELVGDVNDRFIEGIAEGRGFDESVIRGTEAKIFASNRALEVGLVDDIATLEDVIAETVQPIGGGVSAGQTFPGRKQSYDADKEHSEPGTGLGGEPTPREPPEEGDPAIEGGWRRDPPPPAYETEEVVNREWLMARADSLGILYADETTDEELANLITEGVDAIVVPLNEATADVTKQRAFERDYPEQAAQLAQLAETNRSNAAQAFASEYKQFDGSSKGYSTLVREHIQQSHEKIALRQFTHNDLKELLDLVSTKEAVVEWDEKGSGRDNEERVAVTRNFVEDRKQFASLVRQAMTEDKLTQEAAIEHVSKQHPDLAEAYLTGHKR